MAKYFCFVLNTKINLAFILKLTRFIDKLYVKHYFGRRNALATVSSLGLVCI